MDTHSDLPPPRRLIDTGVKARFAAALREVRGERAERPFPMLVDALQEVGRDAG